MAKYYIESGNFKRIVTASDPFSACVSSLESHIRDCMNEPETFISIELEENFVVSEKGFLSCREELTGVFSISIPDEKIYHTDEILDEVAGL